MNIRSILLFIPILLFACSSGEEQDPRPGEDKEEEPVTLSLADPDATAETKGLYSNLWKIQSEGFMFGHHDDLIYGRDWTQEPNRSDVKDVCGDYPAVFIVDFADIMDDRYASSTLNGDRKRTILEARKRG